MSSSKPSVLIVGATGRTGGSIARALLEAGIFNVVASVRPSSMEKPETKQLAAEGVKIRQADVATDSKENLIKLLDDIETLIIAMQVETDQRPLLKAAKEVKSIKRVVPSDWAAVAPPGILGVHDQKLEIRQFIKELGVPYTFIQVGWWLELSFPSLHENKDHPWSQLINMFVENGKPFAITALTNIGEVVKRIIQDDRTLNATVTTWDYVATQRETWEIASKITGEDFSDYPRLSPAAIQATIDSEGPPPVKMWFDYLRLLHVNGDNTPEKAKELGSLDARELYPDYKPAQSLEQAAKANVYDVSFPPIKL